MSAAVLWKAGREAKASADRRQNKARPGPRWGAGEQLRKSFFYSGILRSKRVSRFEQNTSQTSTNHGVEREGQLLPALTKRVKERASYHLH